MGNTSTIVICDKKIEEILTFYGCPEAAPHLFERYRIFGEQKNDFVAALIMRLCLEISRKEQS